MNAPPDLSLLSAADLSALVRRLFAQIDVLEKQIESQAAIIAGQAATITALTCRLSLNSRNSSKPPATDDLNRPKPKSLRKSRGKSSGGQKGHPGRTLSKIAHPDHLETHAPTGSCAHCGLALGEGSVIETRQVFDLPPLRHEVTEHQLREVVCACGTVHRGQFPAEVSAPVQYGPRLKAAVVHLTHHHMLPVARTGDLLGDLFGLPLAEATVLSINDAASTLLAPTVAAMGEAFKTAPVVHADETGMRVGGKRHWLHVLATSDLTWFGAHPHRGRKAFAAHGILPTLIGTLIHDGWKPYRDLACSHALCNAHHLRELTWVSEEMAQTWAKELIDLLTTACHEVKASGAVLSSDRYAFYRTRYETLLAAGEAVNPRAPPSGKRGRTKQSKPLNLIDRLRTYTDDVWRFATEPLVPFTNNMAEQAVRMPKVKQKISGGFRTAKGLETFCTIRSWIATMHKQGHNLFHALSQAFQGNVPQPRFG